MKSITRIASILCGLLLIAVLGHGDDAGLHYPHSSVNDISCADCHFIVSEATPPEWGNHVPTDIDDSAMNNLCRSCHNGTIAPYVQPHSSQSTSDQYHADEDKYGFAGWAMECIDCHWPHHQLQLTTYGDSSYLFSANATSVTTTSLTLSGAAWDDDQFNANILVPNIDNPSYNYKIVDTTSDTITVETPAGHPDPIDLTKVEAAGGDTFAVIYGKLIRAYTPTPNSGYRATRLFTNTGSKSFADGDSTYDGICEVCHTETAHFRNNGTATDQLHDNIGGKEGTDCIDCHSHTGGFGHGNAATEDGCVECHGHDAGTNYDADMSYPYAAGATASQGKGSAQSHSTHTETDGDDLRGPAIYCDICHDIANMPFFASGTDGNADTLFELSETDVCDNCHSQGGAFDGVALAKASWAGGIYEGDGSLQSGKDDWCLTCHDSVPANSKYDNTGVAAPDKGGDNVSSGYNITGHGNTGTYNATLHGQNGPGYLCTVCHDSESAHFSHALGDATRLTAVPDDGDNATSDISEVCLDCHLTGQSASGSLGFDATAEATIHSGAVSGNYDSAGEAATAYPSYGEDGNYATNPGYQCEDCHEVHGTEKLAMVLPTLDGNLGGTSNPVSIAGFESTDTDLSDLDPSATANDGVCDACHLAGDDPHPDTNHAANHNFGQACVSCHPHTGSFAHGAGAAGAGGCVECHGHDAGSEYDPDMASPYSPSGGTSSQGAGSSWSHSTHTETDSDDLLGPQIYCDTCHDTANMPLFKNLDDSGGHTLADTDICNNCHSPGGAYDGVNDATVGAKNNWSLGIYDTDRSLRAGKEKWCVTCHDGTPSDSKVDNSGVDAPDKAGDDTTYGYYITGHGNSGTYNATEHGQNGPAYACTVCHNVDLAHISHTLGDATRLATVPDDALDYTSDITEVCLDCHEVSQTSAGSLGYDATAEASIHSGAITSNYDSAGEAANAFPSYGEDGNYATNPGYQCEDCHEVHGTTKLAMVLATIDGRVGGVSNPVAIAGFEASDTDLSDLDPDNTADNGVCDACHAAASDPHPDSNHAANHNYGNACVTCHSHSDSFAHGGGAGGSTVCVECHGHDAGSEYDPDMTYPASLSGGSSSNGVGTSWSHSTHTETDSDDLNGPAIYCSTCHDLDNMPKFKNLDSTGNHSLADTDICDNCHSPGGTYDGVNDATYGAKANWASGVYEADRSLKSGKEKWCATCHDESASNSKVDGSGIAAPNIVGDEDGAYTYGTGWGFYKTGHGLEDATTYAASGGLTYGAGKECVDCHYLETSHIDHNARTYSAASNNYQDGYRLRNINGYPSVLIPHPMNIDDNDPGLYALCLSCHDANKYLGVTPDPVTTSFRDDEDLGPWDGGDAPINIHEYHLTMSSFFFDSDWDGTYDSKVACVNCHNVHGSTLLSMIRDGKLVGREPGMTMYYDNALTSPTTSSGSLPGPAGTTLNVSTGTIFPAASIGNLCSNCHGGNYVKYYRSPPSAPVAPSLDWTGEAGYTVDGVAPDSGQGGDYFTFRIEYTDANSQPPRTIQVWIDQDDNGTYEEDEKFDMYQVDTDDVDVTDGKVYRTILTLDKAGDSTLSYRFYASDGKFDATDGAATGDPTHDAANTLTINNNKPILQWTGENGYSGDGVSPDSGADGSTFTFRVSYKDVDDDAPASVDLWLDKDDDGTSVGDEGSEIIAMGEVDGGDTTYSDGKLYSIDVVVNTAGDGVLDYNFAATDGSDNAVGAPTTLRSVTVTSANSAPQLTWTGETDFIGDGVAPNTAVAGSTFSFRVKYSDADNDSPATIQVWVDKNDDSDYDDAGEKVDMGAVDSDTDLSDGKLYSADLALDLFGNGVLNYRFYASDGVADATGDPLADNFLTILSGALTVSCPAVGDFDYTTIQSAIDAAADGATILVDDGNCTEALTIDNKDLTILSVNGSAATIIDGNGADTVVTFLNGADTTMQGFTITGGNRGGGYGAGVSVSDSSPTFIDCTVDGNISSKAAGIYMATSGTTLTLTDSTISNNSSSNEYGGVYLVSGVSAVITNTTFDNNTATLGGGLVMGTSVDSSLTVSDSTFTNNDVTSSNGGAIYLSGGGGTVNVTIDNSIFTGNTASQRGGALYASDAGSIFNLTITDSTFSGQSSGIEAGALYFNGLDSVTIEGTTLDNNTAGNSGAMHAASIGALTVSDTTFSNNSITGANGGAMMISGTTATFERSVWSGNTSVQRGGAAYIYTTAPTFKNCMIYGNTTDDFEGAGFVFNGAGISATITNCTFSGNRAGTTGGAINVQNSASVTVKNSIFYYNAGGYGTSDFAGTVNASYSNIKQVGYSGNNNVSIDPRFVNAVSYFDAPTSAGDYHLEVSSPMVDMGTAVGAPADDFDGNLRPIGGGIDMGADEVVTAANNAPGLAWTGESGYGYDGVNPDTGSSGSNFEFRVQYIDADNEAPGDIEVWIDTNDDGDYLDGSEKLAMNPVDADADYTDGKLYTKTVTLNSAGDRALSYRFYADDATEAATGSPASDNTVFVNTAPVLSWLGSGSYTTDGVDPDSGASGATFTFRVTYTDDEDDAPSSIQVWIDTNDDGDYNDTLEHYTMSELDTGDMVYSDGKDYTLSVDLNTAGDGVLNYRFYAADGSEASGTPTSDSTVTLINTAPTLSWLGTGNYASDGSDPNAGTSGSNSFVFKVVYTDADNQAPAAIEVWIDEDDNSTYSASEKFAMTEVDGGDTTYTDGKEYTYTATNLTRVGDDYLNYRFGASDGTDTATGDPATADKQLGVFTANQAPVLAWTGEAGYTADGVDPDSGADGDTFTFRVSYSDAENSAPTFMEVWIDEDDNGTYSAGEKYTLTEVDAGDTAYDDGKLYSVARVLSSLANPSTTFIFAASDGSDDATGDPTTSQTVTVSTPITVCPAGFPTCDYSVIGNAIAAASSGDYILVKDGTYSENINYSGKDLVIYSENGSNSTIIQGSGANSAVVTFDTNETINAVLDGFTIDNQSSSSYTRGILIVQAAPTIKNSIVTNNTAHNVGDSATSCYGGGGVCVIDAIPTFDTVTISANQALNRHGCGMYIKGTGGGAIITNSTIGGTVTGDGNKCTNGTGGGIYYTGATTGSLTITGSNIQFNQGLSNGGGILLTTLTNATVIDSTTIQDNYTGSGGYGGGIYASSAPVEIINGSSVTSNSAGGNRNGGGIYVTGSSLVVNDSEISSNDTGLTNNGEGGGIFFGGTTLTMSKAKVIGNQSTSHGGGIKIGAGATATIVNSQITGNSIGRNDYRYGGGIANAGTLNLYFSTVADNYAYDGGGLDAGSVENVYNSIIWGNAVASTNTEIRGTADTLYLTESSGDTSFESRSTAGKGTPTNDGDYRLQASSNCVDTGDATNKPSGDDDILGISRPVNIDGKGDGTDDYDKGCYEYTPVATADNTTVGAGTAVFASSSSIDISMPYTDDGNSDNTYTVEYKLSSSGTWSDWGTNPKAHTASPYTDTISSLTPGETYDVQLTWNDTDGVNGTNPQTVSSIYLAINETTVAAGTAVAASSSSIDISMPYTNDENSDNTYTVEYKLSSSGTWSDWGTNPKANTASPYTDTITGLTPGETYDVRLTWNDGDTVSGTNPQTVASIFLSQDLTVVGTGTAVAVSETSIDISMPYTGDDNTDNDYTVEYKLSSSGTWSDWGTNPKAHTASPYTDTITGLTPGETYDVRLTWNDTDTVSGTNPQTVSSIVMPVYATTVGTGTAVAASDTTIDVSMPYTDDDNSDNDYTVEYKLSSSGTWSDWGTNPKAHTASPYTDTITGLTSGETYDVRLTWNDTDTVSGTNPQTVSSIVMPVNITTVGTGTAVAASGTSIDISMPYTGDENSDNNYTVEYKLTSSGTWLDWGTNPKAHTATPYTDTITGLTLGETYDVRLTWNDADTVSGTNPQTISSIALPQNGTVIGTVTASGASDTTIAVSLGYSGDDNEDNTYNIDYKLTSSGTWLGWGLNPIFHSPSPYTDTIMGLTPGESYDVRLTFNDTDGVNGTNPQTFSPIVMSHLSTTVGTGTAVSASTTSIDVSMPYTGDSNANNTYTVEYKLNSSGTWSDWGTNPKAHTASPYTDTITGLTPGETYDVRMTWNDANGTNGSNPQTVSSIFLNANLTTVGTATAVSASDTSIDISMPYTNDLDSDNDYTVEYKLSSSGTWLDWGSNPKAHTASPYTDTITGLTPGETYDVRMTYNDSDTVSGTNPQTVSSLTLPIRSVDLTSASQSVAESVGTVTVTATLSAISGATVTVPFTVSGTAIGGGTDHDLADGNVTVTAGQLTGITTFSVTDDGLDESDETVIVTMGSPTNATSGTETVHTVTITDDDDPPAVTSVCASGCDFATIMGAIAASSPGETVQIGDGNYTERIVLDNKDIILTSENGAATTIIDGEGANPPPFIIKNGDTSTIDGLTVRNGRSTGGDSSGYGGGFYINGSSPTITNSIITNNSSWDSGGAIYITGAGHTVTIEDSTISNNSSDYLAGGIYATTDTNVTLTRTTMSGNWGKRGGAILFEGATLDITDSTISDHTNITWEGGAIQISSGTMNLTRTILSGNSANNEGGGIKCTGATANITNSLIAGNKTGYHGGGIWTNCTTTIFNSTFAGNYAAQRGGGLYRDANTPVVTNSIFWGNYAVLDAGDLANDQISDNCTVTYSDIDDGYTGTGNRSDDPLFVDLRSYNEAPTVDGNYTLQVSSPVIDQGTPTGAPADDLQGETRSGNPDMGAYEYIVAQVNSTSAGTATATAASTTTLSISMPYTDDDDENNDYTVEYKLSSSGTWLDWGTNPKTHSASPYTDTITGLTPGENYDVRLTYNDAGGVTGTAEQTFGPITLPVDIAGRVYTDEGVTTISDGATVRLLVNGVSAGTDTTVSGDYSIAAQVSAGDAMLVYIDSADGNGTTVTVSDGNGLSGLDIYADRLITRHDNGGSLTNALIDTAKGAYSDTEILCSVSGSDLTVSATELFIPAGETLVPGGVIDAVDMDINGALNAEANAINISGNWDATGGVFTSWGTVTFDAASGINTITTGGTDADHDFGFISFDDGNGTATFQLAGDLDVDSNLIITDGIFDTDSGSNYAVSVAGVLTQSGGQVNGNSSTFTIGNNFTVDGTDNSTGLNNATLVMTGNNTHISYNNLTNYWQNGFGNLTVGQSGASTQLNNWLSIKGTLTIGSGELTGPATVALSGSGDVLVFDPAANLSIDTLQFLVWGGNQNIPALTNGYGCNIALAGDGSTFNQTGAVTLTAGKDLLVTGDSEANRSITYNTNGYALAVGGNVVIGAGSDTGLKTLNGANSAISVAGNFTITDVGGGSTQATFTSSGSTVTLNGTADQTVTSSGSSLNNLVLNNTGIGGSDDIIVADALDVDGNVTITDGDLDLAVANPTVTVGGNLTNTSSLTAGTSTVVLNGSSQSVNGSTTFYNLTKSVAAADTLTFEAGATTTIAAGGTVTLNGASGQLLTLTSSTGSSAWNFNLAATANTSIDYVNVSWSDASGSDASHKPISPTNSVDGGNTTDWFPGGVNTAPTLAWTGETDYAADGVDPNSGAGGANFTFRVDFTDDDNDTAAVIQVWIDEDDNGTYSASEKYALSETDAGDTDTTDGKRFSLTRVVALAGDGTLNYRFYASDGTDTATGAPVSGATLQVVDPKEVPGEYADIASAITVATAGDIILVGDGTYSENITLDNKDIILQSVNGAGSTIIDGGNTNTAIFIKNGDTSTIDGFTIQNGNATYGTSPNTGDGGAINVASSDLTVKNCVLTSNTVVDKGAGIYVSGAGASVDVEDTTVSSNNAEFGGGIYLDTGTSATITNVDFTGNTTNQHGAAVYSNNSPVTVIGGSYTTNDASSDGGVFYMTGSSAALTIDGSSFTSNEGRSGSVVAALNGATFDVSNATLDNNNSTSYSTIWLDSGSGNSTIINTSISDNTSYGSGGAIYYKATSTANLTLDTVTIERNEVTNTGSFDGGGIYLNGGGVSVDITGGTIIDNSARGGGGIYGTAIKNLTIDGTTIDSNDALTGYAGGIYLSNSSGDTNISNASVSSNTGEGSGPGIYFNSTSAVAFNLTNTDVSDNVQGNLVSYDGGNIFLQGASVTATISGCTVNGGSTRKGGAIFANSTIDLTITGTTMNSNAATSYGGALYMATSGAVLNMSKSKIQGNDSKDGGGGLYLAGGVTSTITNSLITGNRVHTNDWRYGGGIFNAGTLELMNSTIAGNYCKREGGGLYANGTETITNSIIYGNTVDLGTNVSIQGAADTVTYSDIEGGHAGTGNVNANPNFSDLQQANSTSATTAGNFDLTATSTDVINAATGTGAPADDIDGVSRAGNPDMGAYEY